MTASFQFAQTPLPSDLPFTNYGATDIDAGLVVIIDTGNVLGTAGDGIGVKLPTAAQSPVPYPVGVTMEKIPAGKTGRVRTSGIGAVTANGSVTAGDIVDISVDTSKLGWAKAHTAATAQLGQAQSSGGDGDTILVLIQPAKNA